MADANNTGNNMNTSTVNPWITDYIETASQNERELLQNIALTLKGIARNDGILISQSSLKDLAVQEEQATARQSRINNRGQQNQQNGQQGQGYKRGSADNFDSREWNKKTKVTFGKLTDDFEKGLSEALFGSLSPFKQALNESMSEFAKSLGVDVKDLGKELGKRLGKSILDMPYRSGRTLGDQIWGEMKGLANAANGPLNKMLKKISPDFGGMDLGQGVENSWREWKFGDGAKVNKTVAETVNNATQTVAKDIQTGIQKTFSNKNIIESTAKEIVSGSASNTMSALSTGAQLTEGVQAMTKVANSTELASQGMAAVGKATTELVPEIAGTSTAMAGAAGEMSALGALAPELLPIIVAASIALEVLTECIGPAVEGISEFVKALTNVAMRNADVYAKYRQLEFKRLSDDIKSITEAAFDVVQDAAKRSEEVWDSVAGTVAATQQTDKAGVQDLWGSYAQRLKDEGLSSVVSSADIMEKLSTVLEQGLSGKVAEEFAYQATLLNAAVPTQDFFQYAETYATIAANLVKDGKSQDYAITQATSELLSFADGLLYASRELAGGFTTSLQNGADLFKKASDIAIASRTGDVSDISRLLTSVSGVVGAIAPDLASGIVDAVYNAALGGNSSEITALRSMAGVGASNTAFLQELIRNPRGLFSTLFTNLADLQNMSASNYMEVAEALSTVFGISRESFQRVDFKYLADTISQIGEDEKTRGELSENLEALVSGQTVSNDAQMRLQKINEYMVDEGLAYVLDNQVARSIQEHMWEEQLGQDLMNNTYSVELVGSTMSLFTGIMTTVSSISNLLTPSGWVQIIDNLSLSVAEIDAITEDTKQLLELGRVGSGEAAGAKLEYDQLTTTGQRLGVATPIVELLGGTSSYAQLEAALRAEQEYTVPQLMAQTIAGSPLSNIPGVNVVTSILKNGEELIDDIKETGSKLGDLAKTTVDVITGEKELADIGSAAAEAGSSVIDTVVDAGKAAVDALAPAAGKLIDVATNIGPIGQIKGIVNNVQQVGELVDLAGQAQSLAAESSKQVAKSSVVAEKTNKALPELAKTSVSNNNVLQTISKSLASAIGTTNFSGGSSWGATLGTATYSSLDPMKGSDLTTKITTSLTEYIESLTASARQFDNERKQLIDNADDILIERDIARFEADETVLHRGYMTQDDVEKIIEASVAEGNSQVYSFRDWLAKFEQQMADELGINQEEEKFDLDKYLSNYNESITTIERIYQQQEAAKQDAISKARELHEVQFWEDMQNFATVDFPWYLREWERYYIQHEAYTEATNAAYMEAVNLAVEEKGELGDSVLALAEALTENDNWAEELGHSIKDPVLHTNVLLSKILLTVEAIMQQNNETSIVSVPTALSALGLSISNT